MAGVFRSRRENGAEQRPWTDKIFQRRLQVTTIAVLTTERIDKASINWKRSKQMEN